jgi:hypothetical protein
MIKDTHVWTNQMCLKTKRVYGLLKFKTRSNTKFDITYSVGSSLDKVRMLDFTCFLKSGSKIMVPNSNIELDFREKK